MERGKLTKCIGQPKDGIAGQEQGAFTRSVTKSACHLEITLTHSSLALRLSISFRIRSPGAPRTLLRAPPCLHGRVRTIATHACDIRPQVFETGLGRLFARTASFEGAADGTAAFRIGMRPDCEADTMIGDGGTG
jgi:hypothetical protein